MPYELEELRLRNLGFTQEGNTFKHDSIEFLDILSFDGKNWYAKGGSFVAQAAGKSADEAIDNLWLILNKK